MDAKELLESGTSMVDKIEADERKKAESKKKAPRKPRSSKAKKATEKIDENTDLARSLLVAIFNPGAIDMESGEIGPEVDGSELDLLSSVWGRALTSNNIELNSPKVDLFLAIGLTAKSVFVRKRHFPTLFLTLDYVGIAAKKTFSWIKELIWRW